MIFDSNQYEDSSIIEILKQFIFEEKIKINHFLIILNKIDQIAQEKRKAAFLRFKAYLNYHLGDELLSDTNSIITMNSLKLLEEEKIMENFDNFLSYHFQGLTNDTYEKHFKKLVANGYYMNNKSGARKKYSDIEKILDPDPELDQDYSDHISKIAENAGLKLNFDPDEENYENICKLFNLLKKAFLQKDKYFYITPSEYRKKIDEFFDKKDFISLNKDKKNGYINNSKDKKSQNKILNKQLLKCMEKLQSFYKSNIKELQSKTNKNVEKQKNININALGERMENLEKLIACHDKIRITVYGTYNAGKSSTLNSFIGKDLLQVDDEQCTGKPILIRYLKKSEQPQIYRAELKIVKDYDQFSHYAFIEKGEALAEGDEAVRNFISSQNIFITHNYREKKDKTDDFFILKTPIKILDELDLNEEIKNNVEFLDTPGLNTDLMKNEGDLLQKLVEQTFIYLFIIDPKIGGADTIAFKNILENTMLKTIYNRSIVNDSKTFPYLFICNKCDNEKIDFNFQNCNTNINLILGSNKNEKLNFDIIKFSAFKRKEILNKISEYTPENFIEKVENDFFNVLYFNNKNFYDYLDDYIPKDFKKNFNGTINHEFESDQLIKDKIIEILKKKNYVISIEKDIILSKLSGYLSFCNKNFNNLKIADNIMMDELKNKIKTKINIAYEYITNGYKNQVQIALEYIKNFLKIGIIPDSKSDHSKEEEIKKIRNILSDITKIFETNNIPNTLKQFREKIEKELQNKEGLKNDYDNYEEIINKKQNFINKSFQELFERLIPKLVENIQYGVIKSIEENIGDIEVFIDKGKMIIKEKPSMKNTVKTVSGLTLLTTIGAGVVYTMAGTDALIGGLVVGTCVVQPELLGLLGMMGLYGGNAELMVLGSILGSVGTFGLLAVGIGITIFGFGSSIDRISDRKKNAYNETIEKIREKFFTLYNGYEKKVIDEYNAKKEKTLVNVASYLNMCYYPIELDENQRKDLLNEYNNLENSIKNLISQ